MRDFVIKLVKNIQQIMTVPMLVLFIASKKNGSDYFRCKAMDKETS